MSEWISVEERLPTGTGSVLVGWTDHKDAVVAYLCGSEWHPHWDTSFSLLNNPPTHWQPLPEPPKPAGPFYVGDWEKLPGIVIAGKVVYHREAGRICGLVNKGTAQGVADKLNALWQANKGSDKE